MTVKDLKKWLEDKPSEMQVVIPDLDQCYLLEVRGPVIETVSTSRWSLGSDTLKLEGTEAVIIQ